MTRDEIHLALFHLSNAALEAGEQVLADGIDALITPGLAARQAAAAFAQRGGSSRSPAKAEASRRNGAKGGRPRKLTP